MTKEKQKREPWSGHRRVAGLLVLALCRMSGTVGGVYISHRKVLDKMEGLTYEVNTVMGDVPGKTPEEWQRELDSAVEEDTIAMSVNRAPSGKAAGADRGINWLTKNPSNQGRLVHVEVARNNTGRKIYETGVIPPRNYVEGAPPNVVLEAKVYDCTVVLYAYCQENEKYIEQAAVKLELMLLE